MTLQGSAGTYGGREEQCSTFTGASYNSLNSKIRTYKREKEDSESEIEGLQRKLRQAFDEAEQDNSTLTAQLSKLRGSGASRSKKVL